MTASQGRPPQPVVHAKNVQFISLRNQRDPLLRLDVAPFLALYANVILKAVYHATQFEW